jgi:hypothetical protein
MGETEGVEGHCMQPPQMVGWRNKVLRYSRLVDCAFAAQIPILGQWAMPRHLLRGRAGLLGAPHMSSYVWHDNEGLPGKVKEPLVLA